jgi:uncharacterized oxidoreductase
MKMNGNTILITGGGSGIGRALAHRFHDAGNHVIVAGRRQAALDEAIAGRERMTAYAVDIDDAAALAAFAEAVVREHPALNVLINNAGIMRSEELTVPGVADAEAMVATNLLGPIRMTDALIGHLANRAASVIVNVTSGLAFVPLATTPTYSATKAALHSWTVSLRHQLAGKVEVLELIPPAVQTDLTPGQATRADYLPLDDYIDEVMQLWSAQPTPAEIVVARAAVLRRAEAEGRFEQVLATLNPA